MESVFGLAVKATRGEFVLVESNAVDTVANSRPVSVHRGYGESAADAATQITETLTRRLRHPAPREHRGVLGLTSSDGGAAHALLLRDRLADLRFDIVTVGLPAATKALARHLAQQHAAVCLIEPDAVIALMADETGSLTISRGRPTDSDELIHWLNAIFRQPSWRPDSVAVVGHGRLDAITVRLIAALEVPVWKPPHAQAALALGAGLWAAHAQTGHDDDRPQPPSEPPAEQRKRPEKTASLIGMAVGIGVAITALAVAVVMRPVPPNTVAPEKQRPPATSIVHTAPTPPPEMAPQPLAPPAVTTTVPSESAEPTPPPVEHSAPSQRNTPQYSPPSAPTDGQPPAGPQAPPTERDQPDTDCTLLCGISI